MEQHDRQGKHEERFRGEQHGEPGNMRWLFLLALDDLASGAACELVVHVLLAYGQDGDDGANPEHRHGIEEPLQGNELPGKSGKGCCRQVAGMVEHFVPALPLGVLAIPDKSERQPRDTRRQDRRGDTDENLKEDNRRQRRKDGHENAGDRDDQRRCRHHQPLIRRGVDQGACGRLGDDHGNAHGRHRHADRACVPVIG